MTEENFPRGGTLKPVCNKPVKIQKTDENDLFKISSHKSAEKSTKKKSKKPVKKSGQSNSFEEVVSVEKFTYEAVHEDMLILGRVKRIEDYKIVVSLPENVVGIVSVTDVNLSYTSVLKEITTGSIEEESVGTLDELLDVGQLICCRVKSVEKGSQKKNISLTLDPSYVNRDIDINSISAHCILHAAVESKEDHGYSIDLGLQGFKGFVPCQDVEKVSEDKPLLVGQPVMCTIDKNSIESIQSGNQRVLNVKLLQDRKIVTQSKGLSLMNIPPGTIVSGSVSTVDNNGITVKYCGKYKGYIHRHHLNSDPSKFSKNQQVTMCVLFHQPLIGVSCLSLLSHLTDSRSEKVGQYKLVKVGDTITSRNLLNVEPKYGALLKFKNDILGYLPLKYTHDIPEKCNLSKLPKAGLQCRVIDFDMMNNVAIVSIAKSYLNRKFLKITDYTPGYLVDAKVLSFQDGNILVLIDGAFRGLIPAVHNANVPLKRPEARYKVGEIIKCRILQVPNATRGVTLTAKESLVNSELPIVHSFDQLKKGLVAEGFVVKILQSGLVIVFYNGVRGFVVRSEAGKDLNVLHSNFYVGQVVKCRVLSWCPESERLQLSLKVAGEVRVGVKEFQSQAELSDTVTHSCRVMKVADRGLSIRVGQVNGFIPVYHLSDNLDNCRHLIQLYRPYQTIDDLVLFERAATPIFTLKKTILDAFRERQIPQSVDDLIKGMTVPAVVRNAADFGVFIQISPSLRGVAINKLVSDQQPEVFAEYYKFGRTVLANIKDLEPERKKILCSLRMSDCYHGDTKLSIDLLSQYLSERREIVEHYKVKGKETLASLLQFDVGVVVDVEIEKLTDHGAIGHEVGSGVKVIATIFHMSGSSIKVGEVRKAVVLHQDMDVCCLEVSLSAKFVDAITHRADGPTNKVKEGNRIDAEVLLVKPDFILLALKGRAEYKLAYAPAQKCPNDVLGSHLFEPGFTDRVIVKKTQDFVVCGWEGLEVVKNKEKLPKRPDHHKLKLGSKVRCVVKQVLPFQLNIRIGSIHGRIFATELESDCAIPGEVITSRFSPGQCLDAVVIGFRSNKSQKLLDSNEDLSQALPDCSILRRRFDGDISLDLVEGQKVSGAFQYVKDQCAFFKVSAYSSGMCRFINANIDVTKLTKPGSIESGACFPLYISKSTSTPPELSMFSDSNVSVGSVVMGCVHKVKNNGLLLRLSGDKRGFVSLTELSDRYEDGILGKFSIGEYHKCKIIDVGKGGCGPDGDRGEDVTETFIVSFRASRCFPWLKSGRAMDRVVEKKSDLVKNEILRGFVHKSSQNSVTVNLGHKLYAVADKKNISDNPVRKMKVAFPKGKLVAVKVMDVDGADVAISLKFSDTGFYDGSGDNAVARRIRRDSAGIDSDLSEEDRSPLPVGRKRKISESSTESTSSRLRRDSESEFTKKSKTDIVACPALGTRKRRLSEMSDVSEKEEEDVTMDEMDNIDVEALRNVNITMDSSSSEEEIKEVVKSVPEKKRKKDDDKTNPKASVKKSKKEHDKNAESSKSAPSKKRKIDNERSGDKPASNKKKTVNTPVEDTPHLKVNESFAWVSDFTLPTKKVEDDDSSDEDIEKTPVAVKINKKVEEKKLMELENRLLDTSRSPETEEEFDRLVVQKPDSSMVWMQYMAYHLKMAEIDKARKVAERALKTISFREEQEKLNVWVALMNLENTFGSPDQLKDVFDRAVQMNDPFKVHCQLVKIYEDSDKSEQAERLHGSIVRQFGVKKDVWINFGQFYFRQNRFDSARKILERSLKSLDKRDHMEVVTKFGRLEFENGQAQQAIELFERVLSECPKRVDVWMVYLDLLIKFSTPEKVRKVFLKVVDSKIQAKKMKSVFKKWLDFETKYGDQMTVDGVKDRATKYANSHVE